MLRREGLDDQVGPGQQPVHARIAGDADDRLLPRVEVLEQRRVGTVEIHPGRRPAAKLVTAGRLDLGPWEQIFYYELDGKRDKRVLAKIIGA